MTINNHYIITMNPHNFPWNRQVQLPSLEALAQAQAQALQVQVAQAQMLAQAQAAWVFHRQIKTHVWYIETRHKLVKSYTNLHEIRFTEQILLNLENIYIYIWGTLRNSISILFLDPKLLPDGFHDILQVLAAAQQQAQASAQAMGFHWNSLGFMG